MPERAGSARDRSVYEKLAAYRREIAATRQRILALQRNTAPEPVEDYVFATSDGERRLSELFGEKDDLFVIHNMGASCKHCTLWADGFNGIYPHLADRAAFIVSSPDPPDVQKRFAESRGWHFPMVSHSGTSFAADMGYVGASGRMTPGVSAFRRKQERIFRVSSAGFDEGDDFCALWHLFDLLPEGAAGWSPKLRYPLRPR